MNRYHLLLLFLFFTITSYGKSRKGNDYNIYHQEVIKAEQLIAEEQFQDALKVYANVFESYDFVFLHEYKIASQLAILTKNNILAIEYLKLGISNGWPLKQIKKNKLIGPLLDEIPKSEVLILVSSYNTRIDSPLRDEVHELYNKDQNMALKAFIKIRQNAKVRFNEQKFAPHSETQLSHMISILDSIGYPGEKLVGNDYWGSTILSHHNSISTEYNKQDTLYNFIRPKLLMALKRGQISPFEFALIENWRTMSLSNFGQVSYGFLGPVLNSSTVKIADSLREKIGMRSVELRNQLVDIQTKYGIDFYFRGHPWQDGKIKIAVN